MSAYRIGIVGLGKIAQDQHVPVIAADPDFDLVAVASQRAMRAPGVSRAFTDWRDLLADPDVDAVAICTPPGVRHQIASAALDAGKHVLLEKPPAATLSELVDLERRAAEAGRVVFTTWHSQYNRGVEEARLRLAGQRLRALQVTWKEDVRRWHPGQAWIWEAGGFGVFDPGINALSIVTRIAPEPIFVRSATLETPENAQAPIAATLELAAGRAGERLGAVFDWRQTGPQTWDIDIETEAGAKLALRHGGSRLEVDGTVVVDEPAHEYEGIYRRFAELLRDGSSQVDAAPLRLVADAFMVARRTATERFDP
ncbi:Gfo/Idh/MocA family oxidoreductase [Alsobacter sp. SYSU M60028]|uniref:Gfo/Idh/MocA family oxidoreductase n=1 Tax=Alsobacter ponti TaxID=2962936 RepID=A0ABT1LH97_9HYPH|nr:Gfo/Idh/MocA family oxidoreductase [Alsobacter ponti]MCP8940882.1 Gfo/Idh/MocA family oxidoreductase [Alsobacter ponti]